MREVLSNTTETHLQQHWRSGEMKFQQIYFFKWAVFSKVIFISLFSYSIENKRGTFTFSQRIVRMISTGITLKSLKLN